jgi:UPF0716 protein FxsA
MNISRWFLFALLSLPILEIYVLVKLIGALGFLLTLALLLGAAAFGMSLLRVQGFSTLLRVRQALERGELPALEMVESGLVAAGGLLLLIPGFLSDILALGCLIPAIRHRLALHLLKNHIMAPPVPESRARGRITIEGEFKRED